MCVCIYKIFKQLNPESERTFQITHLDLHSHYTEKVIPTTKLSASGGGGGGGSFKVKYTDRFLDFYKVLGFVIKSNFQVKHITLGVSTSDIRKLGQLQTQKFHIDFFWYQQYNHAVKHLMSFNS